MGHTRCAEACERIDAFMSTENRLRKPCGGEIDVGMHILTIKPRLEIGRSDGWSRIQESAKHRKAEQLVAEGLRIRIVRETDFRALVHASTNEG